METIFSFSDMYLGRAFRVYLDAIRTVIMGFFKFMINRIVSLRVSSCPVLCKVMTHLDLGRRAPKIAQPQADEEVELKKDYIIQNVHAKKRM